MGVTNRWRFTYLATTAGLMSAKEQNQGRLRRLVRISDYDIFLLEIKGVFLSLIRILSYTYQRIRLLLGLKFN